MANSWLQCNKKERLPYGYTAYTGKIWTDSQVDHYNRMQDTINRWIDETGGYVPEHVVNGSHYTFVMNSTVHA